MSGGSAASSSLMRPAVLFVSDLIRLSFFADNHGRRQNDSRMMDGDWHECYTTCARGMCEFD